MNKIISSGNNFIQNILQKVLTDTKVRRRCGLSKMIKFWENIYLQLIQLQHMTHALIQKKILIRENLETTFWLLFCV